MRHKPFHICAVIAEGEDDYSLLQEYLGNYPVSIYRNLPDELYFDIPTLIIGWNCIKHKFPLQNILDEQIEKNLFWSFSKTEDEKQFYNQVEAFFSDSVKKWLPNKFELYDPILNSETIQDFICQKINKNKKIFIYFHKGALYMYNDDTSFVVNIKSLFLFDKDFKKTLTGLFNLFETVFFSHQNIYEYVEIEELKKGCIIDTLRWVKYGVETTEAYFNIIPNFDVHRYIPFLMSNINLVDLDINEQAFYQRMLKKDEITCWLSNREIAFLPTFDNLKLNFKIRRNYKLSKINFSDKRTITGRIVSADLSKYNIQNLDKHNDERKNIVSRFNNGNILVYDYVTFETKLSIYETQNQEYIAKHENSDFHKEIAIVLYETHDIAEEQREFAKSIVHPLIYGSSENSLLSKLKNFNEPEYKLYQIKKFLKPIIERSSEVNKLGKERGYVITPFGSIIRLNKENAGFNNYMQAYASEIIVDKLFEIKNLLSEYKTKFLFQVYDSLVFDLHPSETFLIEQIKNTLSRHGDMQFGLKIQVGSNYKELRSI